MKRSRVDGRAAHRTMIVRKLKGLEDIISITSVHWHMGEKGACDALAYQRIRSQVQDGGSRRPTKTCQART